MVDILPIFFSGARNSSAQAGDIIEENGHILIDITNAFLEAYLRDCLKENRQTDLYFTNIKTDETTPDPTHWVAFHFDMSDVLVFTNELDACRYAWRNSMRVAPYIPGESIHDTIHNTIRQPGNH